MPNFGGSRLGFWNPGALETTCGLIPDLTLNELIAAYGNVPGNSLVNVDNGFIRYTINGKQEGALGNGGSPYGIQFDISGNGNYGTDDYLKPGSPFEGWRINTSFGSVGGDNSSSVFSVDFPPRFGMWNLSVSGYYTHYVFVASVLNMGDAILHYVTYKNEPSIRIKMSFHNKTNSVINNVQMLRSIDPDVDALTFGEYQTKNYRGYTDNTNNIVIPSTDLVYALGNRTGKSLALYCPGNRYQHNTAVISNWPSADITPVLNGRYDGFLGDYAISCAWNVGTVLPNEVKSVCCYYVCGLTIEDAVYRITGIRK